MFGVTDKDRTCNGTFLETIFPSDGLPAIMTKHAGLNQVLDLRLAMPQGDIHEIKQNVTAKCFNFYFSVNEAN